MMFDKWTMLTYVAVSAFLLPLSLQADDTATIRGKQLTSGPNHHFFGYIGQCRTSPWSADGRYILTLRNAFQDRMPGPRDAADVCVIDTKNGDAVIKLDTTEGWNPQQGTMFYWHPEHPETRFFFNDRDRKTGKVFTVLYDLPERKRIREYRFEDTPVGNGGVAQNGGYFIAINYARMARLRLVTGYPGAWDWTEDGAAPENDGLFRIDIKTGEKRLIVSFSQLKKKLAGTVSRLEERHLFINHTLNNRNNDLIYFYCRADFDKKDRVNVPFTVRPDGSELTRHETFIGGHPEWEFGPRIIGSSVIDGKKHQVVYDVDQKKIVEDWGDSSIFPNPEGDVALSPDGSWFVNGTKSSKGMVYTFLNRLNGDLLRSEMIPAGDWKGELRVDPAPSWNRTSTQILAPGIAPDGTRQIFLVTIR